MLILNFDTCFNKTYITLRNNENIIENIVVSSTDKDYHSVFLIPKIRDILRKNNILIKDLTAIGVNIGPGSFTGIRAGITIARVLAQQANLKLVGVPSLQILSKINKNGGKTTVILDARKNKVYFAEYAGDKTITEPMLVEVDLLVEKTDKNSFIVTDSKMYELLKENGLDSVKYEENDPDLGLYLDDITYKMLKNSDNDFNWAKVKPLYIQPPSISKPKAVKNV